MKPLKQSRIPTMADGRPGCASCGTPATRLITYNLYQGRIRMQEAFCNQHGSYLLQEPGRRPVKRPHSTA
jgi:hypothetical protein